MSRVDIYFYGVRVTRIAFGPFLFGVGGKGSEEDTPFFFCSIHLPLFFPFFFGCVRSNNGIAQREHGYFYPPDAGMTENRQVK